VAKFPTEALGERTWVLVRSEDWKHISKTLGLNPYRAAFTCLKKKTTFIEEALVTHVSGRANKTHPTLAHGHDGTVGHRRGTRNGTCPLPDLG
jgi:hypothetical protein